MTKKHAELPRKFETSEDFYIELKKFSATKYQKFILIL